MTSVSAQLRQILSTAAKRDPVKASRAAGVTLTVLRAWLDGSGVLKSGALVHLANFAGYEVAADGVTWKVKPKK